MKKNEPVRQIMNTNVRTVHTGQKISDVRKLLAEHRIHHVPVVSGQKLVGLLSASDVLGLSVEGVGSDQRSMDAYLDHQFSIESQMKKSIRTVAPDSTIRDAAELLSDGDFHALPVVEQDKLVGIVTSTDLIRYLRDQF